MLLLLQADNFIPSWGQTDVNCMLSPDVLTTDYVNLTCKYSTRSPPVADPEFHNGVAGADGRGPEGSGEGAVPTAPFPEKMNYFYMKMVGFGAF